MEVQNFCDNSNIPLLSPLLYCGGEKRGKFEFIANIAPLQVVLVLHSLFGLLRCFVVLWIYNIDAVCILATMEFIILQPVDLDSMTLEENEEPSVEDLLLDLDHEMSKVCQWTCPNRVRQLLAKIAYKVHKEKEPGSKILILFLDFLLK